MGYFDSLFVSRLMTSTTRAGTVYKRMEEVHVQPGEGRGNGLEGRGNGLERRGGQVEGGRDGLLERREGVEEMMQWLVQDRQRREMELAEERRLREEERQRREAEFLEERRRQREESVRREEQSLQQLRVLQALVEGVHLQGEAAKQRADSDKDVKVPRLTEQDDIVSYLTMFERLMAAFEVRRERWAYKLASNLSGKAQKAYASLPVDKAGDYDSLKEAVLRRYDITDESYRQRFRSGKRGKDESNKELVTRLNDLATKWLKSKESREQVLDQIVLEQFLKTLPDDVRVFVQERSPGTSGEAAQLADDFLQARKEDLANRDGNKRDGRKCLRCGKVGHLARECRTQVAEQPQQKQDKGPDHTTSGKGERPKRDLKDIECYNCHKKGHYSANCPQNALFCTERRVDHGMISEMHRQQFTARPGVLKTGVVEGKAVSDILLDTGCSRTLVHQKLVPIGKLRDGEAVAIRCAHGDTVLYPLAQISLEVNGKKIEIEAAVSDTLPMSVLLGTDAPELAELLKGCGDEAENALAVSTRAQAKKEKEREEERDRQEQACDVRSNPIEEVWMNEMGCMEEEMFGKSHEKIKKTRKEKREERRRRQQLETDGGGEVEELGQPEGEATGGVGQHELDISLQELKELQADDATLKQVWEAVERRAAVKGTGFFTENGLLYRRWIPRGRDESMAVEQLVLPKRCRGMVVRLAHSIPLAGHLGRDKTTRRVLQRFYWPTVYRDIAQYCRRCGACQKTSGKKLVRVPLIPLPVIAQPFQRIAMDIVGPLPRSEKGNRYVLVVCDYATRYPEAVPMRHIDAASVADELIKIFSRVGVPQEILTDQGSNFTSQLLAELYRMLHVKPIRTTPYHPQTDGLVERFNQTLKLMLRKTTAKEGKDWDRLLPFLLFAYREVPQASTGFSPFELLYGHQVRGPLDILSESWQSDEKSDESIISHILSTREKLEKMKELADTNVEQAQLQQKQWFDRNAREREFQAGDMVLLLLPSSTSKLLAQWQGPFKVVKKVGRANYQIEMPRRRKKQQIFHVNLLKKWESPEEWSLVTCEVGEEEEFPDWRGEKDSLPTFGEQLTTTQRKELDEVLREFADVMCAKPGQTKVVEHTIDTESKPIRQAAYRIPHAYREGVLKELEEMKESGIIEPSCSEWASPIGVARKKDGSIRLCVDYRKLNAATPMDAYPMPRVDELLDKVGRATFISTLDLARGYWQVPVAKKDRAKTAFITPDGLYQFRVMPFGLNGAPATFQRMMDNVIRGLESFTADYIDDIAIFSDSWDEHLGHIREVLLRLQKSNLTAKPKKCQFGMCECIFLGYMVGRGNVRPDPEKVKAVKEYPVPVTKKQVRGFLGLTGYYRRFIENYASVAIPLTDMTRKSMPDRVDWTPESEAAFKLLKQALCQSPVLGNPDFDKQFTLQTDASDRGVGAVLSQEGEDGKERPVAYFSRKLLPREVRYSTVEKECLAIKLGVEAFRVYLLGREFVVQTDHRSLVWLDKLKDKNARLARWSLILQQYSFTVTHRAGSANGNADALSRASLETVLNAGEGGRNVED